MNISRSVGCALALSAAAAAAWAQEPAQSATSHPSPAESTFAARIAGCYEFPTEKLRADTLIARFATVPTGPIRFALRTRPAFPAGRLADGRDYYFAVDTDTLPEHGHDLFRSWLLLHEAEESAFVATPLPWGGISLRLAPRGRDLAGTFTAMTDAIPPDGIAEASQPIVARRTSCVGIPSVIH